MKLRRIKKNFWWTWRCDIRHQHSSVYGFFDWGVGRVKHQLRNKLK